MTILYLALSLVLTADLPAIDFAVDKAKMLDYLMPAFQKYDSVLVLGEIQVFAWDENHHFFRADSGVHVSLGPVHNDIVAGKNGLFWFVLPYNYSPDGWGTTMEDRGAWYGNYTMPNGFSSGFVMNPVDGIYCISGSNCSSYRTDIKIPEDHGGLDDTMYQYGYKYLSDEANTLVDFCRVYPENRYTQRVKRMLSDMELIKSVNTLLRDGKYDSSRLLILDNAIKTSLTDYLAIALIRVYIKWSYRLIKTGDTNQAIAKLKECLHAGEPFGVQDKYIKISLITAVQSPSTTSSLNCDEESPSFEPEVQLSVMADLFSELLSPREMHIFRYNILQEQDDWTKNEAECIDWINDYPEDTVPYVALVEIYNQHQYDDTTCPQKAVKLGNLMMDNKVKVGNAIYANLGYQAFYAEEYRSALRFFDADPEIMKNSSWEKEFYLISLCKTGKLKPAWKMFTELLQATGTTDEKQFRPVYYTVSLVRCAFALRKTGIVDSLYDSYDRKENSLRYLELTEAVVDGYHELSQHSRELEILNAELNSDTINQAPLWEIVGDQYAQDKKLDSAMVCYTNCMKKTSPKEPKYGALLKVSDHYLKEGMTDTVIYWMKYVLTKSSNNYFLVNCIKDWCNKNKLPEILESLDTLLEIKSKAPARGAPPRR